jgi:hypothetical protein
MEAKKDTVNRLHYFNTIALTVLTAILGYMVNQIDTIKSYQLSIIERVVKVEIDQQNICTSCAEFKQDVNDRFLKMEAYIRDEEKYSKNK